MCGDGLFDDIDQIDCFEMERNLASIKACDLQESVDDICQLMSLYIDNRDTLMKLFTHFRIELRVELFCSAQNAGHHLTMSENDREGGTKLMSGDGKKFVFESIRTSHGFLIGAGNFHFLLPTSLFNSQTCKLGNAFSDSHIPDIERGIDQQASAF